MRMMPSAEAVAKSRPRYFGANSTSVTLVRESTSVVRRTQRRVGALLVDTFSPMTSSHTEAVRSKEHVAMTWPNSGLAHDTRQIEPECAFQLLVTAHLPCSSSSQICKANTMLSSTLINCAAALSLPLLSDHLSRSPCDGHNSRKLRRVWHLCGPQLLAPHQTCLFLIINV